MHTDAQVGLLRQKLMPLCALIPPPRVHLVRDFGAFAPTARGRAALVGRNSKTATVAPATIDNHTRPPAASVLGDPPDDPNRPARLEWAALLRRVYRVHRVEVLVCTECSDRLRLVAFVTGARIARKILDHLAIPPVIAPPPARPPPTFDFDVLVDDPLVDPIYNN